jgi:hypothetical protein
LKRVQNVPGHVFVEIGFHGPSISQKPVGCVMGGSVSCKKVVMGIGIGTGAMSGLYRRFSYSVIYQDFTSPQPSPQRVEGAQFVPSPFQGEGWDEVGFESRRPMLT